MVDSSSAIYFNDSMLRYLFRDIQLLGRGGYATVYSAHHVKLDRKVAIKILSAPRADDLRVIARFRREAQALNQLQHENVVKVYASGTMDDGNPYIVMEFLEGVTLSNLLANNTGLTMERIEKLFRDVVTGVGALHKAGIIHRDLTPANCMVMPATATEPEHAKIIDFGLVKWLNPQAGMQNLTRRGEACGTYAYMSPEICLADEVDERSDIYSLGCLLFFLMTGQPPFLESTGAALMKLQVEGSAGPAYLKSANSNVSSPAAEHVVATCLKKEPASRYQSVHELLSDIKDFSLLRPAQAGRMVWSKKTIVLMSSVVVVVATMVALGVMQNSYRLDKSQARNIRIEPSSVAALEAISRKLDILSNRLDGAKPLSPQRAEDPAFTALCVEVFDLHLKRAALIERKFKEQNRDGHIECKRLMIYEYHLAWNAARTDSQQRAVMDGLSRWTESGNSLNLRAFWARDFLVPIMIVTSTQRLSLDHVLDCYNVVCGRSHDKHLTLSDMCLDIKHGSSAQRLASVLHLLGLSLREGKLADAEQLYTAFANDLWADYLQTEVRDSIMIELARAAQKSGNDKLLVDVCTHLIPALSEARSNPCASKEQLVETWHFYSAHFLGALHRQGKLDEEKRWLRQIIEWTNSCSRLRGKHSTVKLFRTISDIAGSYGDKQRQAEYTNLAGQEYQKINMFDDAATCFEDAASVLASVKQETAARSQAKQILALEPKLHSPAGLGSLYLAKRFLDPGSEHLALLVSLRNSTRSRIQACQLDNESIYSLCRVLALEPGVNEKWQWRELRSMCAAITYEFSIYDSAPIMLHSLTQSLDKDGDHAQADKCLERLLRIANGLQSSMPYVYRRSTLIHAAQALADRGHFDEALKYARKALELSSQIEPRVADDDARFCKMLETQRK
jgi:serine/threonine protein kinase